MPSIKAFMDDNRLKQEADRPKCPRQAQRSTPLVPHGSLTCEISKSLPNQRESSQ